EFSVCSSDLGVMEQVIELRLPSEIALWANEIATLTDRDLQAILIDWLKLGLEGIVAQLSNEQVISLSKLMMNDAQNEELSKLLAQQREREISDEARVRLRELLDIYEYGMLWKAEALKVGVQRGILPPMHP